MQIPMFGFVLLSFLLLAVVLAVAVFFAFKSGQTGTTKLSGPAGCLVALALLVIAGIGAIGLLIVALVTIPSEAVRHGPVKSIKIEAPDEPVPGSTESGTKTAHPLRVTIELRGLQDPSEVMKWLRRRTDAETHIAVHDGQGSDGKPVTIIELSLPDDHDVTRELRDMRRDLEQDAPDLRLPKSVKIEFRGPDE